jgi:hypothetical protein
VIYSSREFPAADRRAAAATPWIEVQVTESLVSVGAAHYAV